jgi:hypothetical protein
MKPHFNDEPHRSCCKGRSNLRSWAVILKTDDIVKRSGEKAGNRPKYLVRGDPQTMKARRAGSPSWMGTSLTPLQRNKNQDSRLFKDVPCRKRGSDVPGSHSSLISNFCSH